MEISNKENKYIYIIVIICLLIGCSFGYLFGVNSSNVTAKPIPVAVVEEVSQTKTIELPSTITQTVHVNTKTEEEEKEEFKININTASSKELQSLPGIGETIANNIIAYRNENGLFTNISELMNVSRIGTSTFEKIKNEVVVD